MSRSQFVRVDHSFIDGGTLAAVPPTAFKVYIVLLRHAGAKDTCFPSTDRLAKLTGSSARSVLRSVSELEARGLVSVSRRNGAVNQYKINQCQFVTGLGSQPVTNCHGTSDKLSPVPVPNCHTKKKKEEDTTKNSSDTREFDEELAKQSFTQWFGQYPKRTDRKAAYQAYLKTVRELLDRGMSEQKCHEFLLERAAAYAASRQGHDPTYTKSPCNWLAAGNYDDDLESLLQVDEEKASARRAESLIQKLKSNSRICGGQKI